MENIKLHAAIPLDYTVNTGAVKEQMNLEFQYDTDLFYIRVTFYMNLKNQKYVINRTVSGWQNVKFKINPHLLNTADFDILVSLVQTSLGHSRLLFAGENHEQMIDFPPFIDNKNLNQLLRTLIQTHYN